MENLLSDYQRDGVARVEGVFTVEEMNAARASAFMTLRGSDRIRLAGYPGRPLETVNKAGVDFPALLFWPTLVNPYLDHLRSDARMTSIVRTLLGDDVKQVNNQIYFRLPGDSDSFGWHQDVMFRHPLEDYPGIVEENGYLQSAIVIDPMTEDNSPIQFVLGSHKLGDLGLMDYRSKKLREYDENEARIRFKDLEIRPFTAQSGDVLIWSSLTVHGSSSNRSNKSRTYYMNGFARAKNCKPWPYYLHGGKTAPIDPQQIPGTRSVRWMVGRIFGQVVLGLR